MAKKDVGTITVRQTGSPIRRTKDQRATLSGLGQAGEGFAFLAGRTVPFDQRTLEQLYPGGLADYLDRFAASLDATIAAGEGRIRN